MSAKNGNFRAFLKFAFALAIVIAASVFARSYFSAPALVATVTRGTAVDIVTGSVVVHAEGGGGDYFPLKSELPGRVKWCDPLDPKGPGFKKDDELLRLDSDDLKRQMKEAEETYNAAVERARIKASSDPRLKVAQREADEIQRLFERGEKSKNELDKARQDLEKTKTDLAVEDLDLKTAKSVFEREQAERSRNLEKMTIRAPFDGKVQEVMVRPTALIAANSEVATIYSNARLVVAKVSEDNIGKVKVGDRAKLRLLSIGSDEFDAKVSAILPYADADTQRFTVYLEVIDPKLTPDRLVPAGTGEVTITVNESPNQPLVDRRALFSGIDGYYAFVVKDGRVEKRKVKPGLVALNKAEVKAGLTPGEQVITDNLEDFRDGQHVQVVTTK